MPRVSILLTCYNHIRFLPQCIEAAFAQTERDFEVVAIDDDSADGTRECLAACERPISRVYNERNLGTYAALNRALAQSTGEFVAILNDDDLWAPTKLERQLELFARHPELGLVHTGGNFIDADGHKMEGSPLGFDFPRTETGDVLLSLIYANKIIASAALVRRECFEAVGGFNEKYFGSGDWDMWLRIAESYPVGYVDEPLTFYRVHGNNASHRLERIWHDDEMIRRWIQSRAEAYTSRGYGDALRKALAHNSACLGTVLTLNGDPGAGRRAYSESLRYDPTRFKSRLRRLATYLPRSVFKRLA